MLLKRPMNSIVKKFSFANLIALSVLMAISSCADGGNRRFRPSDVQGVDGLESSEFTSFAQIISQGEAPTSYPNDNTELHIQVSYIKPQTRSFEIELNATKYNCQYTYTEATHESRFVKEVVTNNQGADVVEYKYQTTIIPLTPTYTTIPQIEEIKKACDQAIDGLNQVGEVTTINFEQKWKEFQALMNEHYIDLLDRCARGARANGQKCIGASFSRSEYSEANPIDTYAFTIEFQWISDQGVSSSTTSEIQVAPSLYYMESYGLLGLKSALPLSSSAQNIEFNSIETLKLSGL